MSKATNLLHMLETELNPKVKDIMQGLLPVDMELVSANDLLNDIQNKYDKDVAQDFMEFVLKEGTPRHKDLLIEFFKSKKDILSSQYLKRLESM